MQVIFSNYSTEKTVTTTHQAKTWTNNLFNIIFISFVNMQTKTDSEDHPMLSTREVLVFLAFHDQLEQSYTPQTMQQIDQSLDSSKLFCKPIYLKLIKCLK